MPTDTSEKGLETRTINLLLESGWLPGDNQDYQPASYVDLAQLAAFLHNTQPETAQERGRTGVPPYNRVDASLRGRGSASIRRRVHVANEQNTRNRNAVHQFDPGVPWIRQAARSETSKWTSHVGPQQPRSARRIL